MVNLQLVKPVMRLARTQIVIKGRRGNAPYQLIVRTFPRKVDRYQATLNAPETMLGWNARMRAKHSKLRSINSLRSI